MFHKDTGTWAPHKACGEGTIGCVFSASPVDSEHFCLHFLLLHVPGLTCYEDVRTVNGQTVDTFKEACILRYLLDDDTEWDLALEEASAFQMPCQLRRSLPPYIYIVHLPVPKNFGRHTKMP